MDTVYLERANAALERFPTLRHRGITPEIFLKFGVSFGTAGSLFIPLYDINGSFTGTLERTACGAPKYRFDPPNMVVTPFNLNNRRDQDDCIVPVFESPFDVMPCPIFSIAIIGLQPSDFGLRLLESLRGVFVIAFDKDTPGQGSSYMIARRLLARHRHVIVMKGGADAVYNHLSLGKIKLVAQELATRTPNLVVMEDPLRTP